jgi:hypothetical protein
MNRIRPSKMIVINRSKKYRWMKSNNKFYSKVAIIVYYLIKNKEGK